MVKMMFYSIIHMVQEHYDSIYSLKNLLETDIFLKYLENDLDIFGRSSSLYIPFARNCKT